MKKIKTLFGTLYQPQVILWIGIIIIVAMCLFPPFVTKVGASTDPNTKNKPQILLDEQLISAIQKRDVNAIHVALKNGANPNWVSKTKVPVTVIGHLLMEFVTQNDANDESHCLRILNILFGAGAKFQPQYDNDMLFFPISQGYSNVMELLINKGADVNYTDTNGITLVEAAESHGKDDVVSVLMKHGASPIMHQDAIEARLIQCAADGDLLGVQDAVKKGASIHIKDKSGETALTAAMGLFPSAEKSAVVKYLFDKGANPNEQNDEWGTPLHILMYSTQSILQDKFANAPRVQSDRIAAISMIDMALKAGAHVSARNKKGQTPLHIAARWNNCYGARKLIESGAKIMDKDNSGKIPLDYAESAEMIKLLKSHGANEQ